MIEPTLIDTHCHLHFPPYESDLKQVLLHLREKNIAAITIGTALQNSERGIKFAEKYAGIWATVGLQPEHVTSDFQDVNEGSVEEHEVDETRLEEIARSSKKVVAIGETGLDFFRLEADQTQSRENQERVLETHLRVAYRLSLPVAFHCRAALGRLAEILQSWDTQGKRIQGVVHSFTGTWEEAKPLLDLGLSLAVNGIATFPPKKTTDPERSLDRTLERVPLERLLLETDAPYLAPVPYRGKRNEPAWVEEVAKYVAQVRKEDFAVIAKQTTQNAMSLFRLE